MVTQDAGGLAKKGGATWSFIQIADTMDTIYTSKVNTGKADLVLGCDAIVAAARTTLDVMQARRTFVALNSHATPTAAFVHNPQWQFPEGGCEAAIVQAVGAEGLGVFDAEQLAISALGDSIYTNPLLLGYAWQKGHVPVSKAALLHAMALNGVQVPNNQAAFEWGRHCAHDLPAVRALFQASQAIHFVKKASVAELVAQRVTFLIAYQNAAYAETYRALVEQVQQVDARCGKLALSDAVVRNLFKLMAYRDEYEVTRLYADGSFAHKIAGQFEGDHQFHFHLAPPLWAKTNGKGELRKQRFGPWTMNAFRLLARLKGLRGTALDAFGRTQERQQERAWVARYQVMVQEICTVLAYSPIDISTVSYENATELAVIPQDIRGFGHVKERASDAAVEKWQGLLTQFRASATA